MIFSSVDDLRGALPEGELLYVASPYSKYRGGLDAAYRAACKVTARLLKNGVACYSPIGHTHGVALHGGLDPLSHEIFMAADRPLMLAAYGLIVVTMPGWQDSVGMGQEIDYFECAGKNIFYLKPLPEEIRA